MAKAALKTSRLTKVQAERLQKYFGYWVKQNNSSVQKLQDTRMVVLEHSKGNHQLCGDWCAWVRAKKENKPLNKLPIFNMNIANDVATVSQVEEILTTFVGDKKLEELEHPYNSQRNEMLNMENRRVAPKEKNFSKSASLDYRLQHVIGTYNEG